MCCTNQNPCTSCATLTAPCLYNGPDLTLLGSKTGDTIESVFQDIEDYLEAQTIPGMTLGVVYYSEKALGTGSVGSTPTFSTITGTSYTVPLGGDGEYEIEYVGEAFSTGTGKLNLSLKVNGSVYNSMVDREISTNGMTNSSIPFKLFASRINLSAGNTIRIDGSATANNTAIYPRNAVCKITKIS